jgi:hypothetical protein
MINDDWTPDFVKVAPRSVEDDDPLKLEPNAMSLEGLQAIQKSGATADKTNEGNDGGCPL